MVETFKSRTRNGVLEGPSMVDVVAKPTPEKEIPINSFERIEFYVGNAKQAAHFYHHALGFSCVAY